MTNAAAWASSETLPPAAAGKRISTGSALYNQLVELLYDEAAMLDEQRFHDWMALLAPELSYTAPLRVTRQGPQRGQTVIRTTQHYDEDYASIKGRIERLDTKSAWAVDPPSRTRRFVTNVRAWEAAQAGEYEVESYLLLTRSRYEHSQLSELSCMRRDLLRADIGSVFKLVRREIIIDQSVVGMPNIALFL